MTTTTYLLTAMMGSKGRLVRQTELSAGTRADAIAAFMLLLTPAERASVEHVWIETA